ncbi:MAG TPA: hypothetical protein VHK65_06430 [Candidatus Dormibacteraeota bacterium]|nr:hypothetical protein [Candidatus Dormibacteraeota bacterium]
MIWRYLIAAILGLHGVIHAIGFAATWRLGQINAISTTPTFPSGLGSGTTLVQFLGLLWLLLAVAFVGAAVGVASGAGWWRLLAAAAAVLSLVLCLAWWNDAKFGLAIDIAILAGLAITTWVVRPALT